MIPVYGKLGVIEVIVPVITVGVGPIGSIETGGVTITTGIIGVIGLVQHNQSYCPEE